MTDPIIVFDLDGTLVDSAPGILASFHLTLGEWSRPADPEVLATLIGPPLHDSFSRLGFAPEEIDTVVARYREHYASVGPAGTTPYAGTHDLLERSHEVATLAVATAKREDFARRILEEWGLEGYFRTIVGAPVDGRRADKTSLVAAALGREDGRRPVGWMVGDRRFDVEAGRVHGLRTLGVLWGYGSVEELTSAGADALARDVNDAVALLTASPAA